ncbi:MAG: dihydropteroate synthase [Akkermansiaceae bacterium]|nr:dihydropteroate synthase [Akkermansiaceae bacterium]
MPTLFLVAAISARRLDSQQAMIWKTNGHNLDLSAQAQVMGILNTTPDSFSDGGKFDAPAAALAHARQMISEGAAIIDIGGESTRPGALAVSAEQEIRRTAPTIRAIRSEWDGLISIDTTKSSVAREALAAGADIINDVSGLTADPEMAAVCATSDCGIVIMHMQGTPADMQDTPTYSDVTEDVRRFFVDRLAHLTTFDIDPTRLCFDPGIGFGKTLEHNLALLQHLPALAPSGRPLLLGVSRKSFLAKITAAAEPHERDAPTAALTALARSRGIMLHRVHDVKGNLAALRATEALS